MGERVFYIRKWIQGWSLKRFEKETGIHEQVLTKIERNRTHDPSIGTVIKIRRSLGIPLDYFVKTSKTKFLIQGLIKGVPPPLIPKTPEQRIYFRMKTLGVSLEKLAERVGRNSRQSMHQALERSEFFSSPEFELVAKVLGITKEWILTGKEADPGPFLLCQLCFLVNGNYSGNFRLFFISSG